LTAYSISKRIVDPWETDKVGLCYVVLGGPVRYHERTIGHTTHARDSRGLRIAMMH